MSDTPDSTLPAGKVGHNGRWRRVERARAKLEKNADRLMQAMIDRALAGDVKAAKWLLEHTETTNAEGEKIRPLAEGVDSRGGNAQGTPADTGPRIFIGVGLGADFGRLASATPDARPIATPATPARLVSPSVSDHE